MNFFDETNPFPLLEYGSFSYEDAKSHAAKVDELLGYRIELCESQISDSDPGQQNWKNLPIQALQTPYLEIRSLLTMLNLEPKDHVIDLGCAYARMAHVIGRHHPEQTFQGFELENLRVQEALQTLNEKKYPNVSVHTQDMADPNWEIPKAEVYFIYDFGSLSDMRQLLEKLKLMRAHHRFRVVARGRGIRHLIQTENPWLSEVNDPKHFDHFSIYQS